MIIKEYGKYRAICDNCENDLPPTESYAEARKQMSRYGWKKKKEDDGRWYNYCQECAEAR